MYIHAMPHNSPTYSAVPTRFLNISPGCSCMDKPKSATLRARSPLVHRRMFSGWREGRREGGRRREKGKEGRRKGGREGRRERGKEGGRGTDVTVMSCDAWHARNGVKEGRACGQVQLGREQVKQALSPHRHRGTRYTKDTHTDRQTDRQARLYTYTYTHSQGIDVSALFFRMQGKWHEMFATTQTVETSSHPQSAVLAYLHTLTHSLSSQKRQL